MGRHSHSHWEWWQTGISGRTLHYLPAAEDESFYRKIVDGPGVATTAAACGKVSRFHAPGIPSRMSAPRCPQCCKALGIERGNGTPLNQFGPFGKETA